MLEELVNNLQMGNLGPLQILSNLLVTLVLTLTTSSVYRWTHSGYAYSRSFNMTMVTVAMVVSMMMVIGSYLALSLGLIGALSVIRFRTAVKDPKDMAFLFISIAIGLACSTGDYAVAVVGTLVIDLTVLVLHFFRFGSRLSESFVLSFSVDTAHVDMEAILGKARQRFERVLFRSFAYLTETEGEYVFSLSLGSASEGEAIRFFAVEAPALRGLTLIAPESSIES